MSKEIRIQPRDLGEFIQAVLERLAVPKEHAIMTADKLVTAHLRGYDTHGLPCLDGYVACLEEGRMNPAPKLEVVRNHPWSAQVDGENGLGQVAGTRGMECALESADQFGIGCAAVKGSNHFGAACAFALMALERDCIGLVMSNASAVTAPFGAAQPLLGTNPFAVAVPADKLPPFVMDMATSAGARKKIRKAADEDTLIPEGWALDPDGNPTTDPHLALKGVMLPFGGLKGSAITLLTDILSGVFSGANFGGDVLSVFSNQERPSGNGHFMLALKIDAFMPGPEFKARMDEELSRVMALAPARGTDKVVYPGYGAHQTEQRRLEQGIALPPALVEKNRALAQRLIIQFPC